MSISVDESKQLNRFIGNICNSDNYHVYGLDDRCFPYIGYSWRPLDFTNKYLPLGYVIDTENKDKNYVGFMPRNDIGYPESSTTPEQTEVIIRKLKLLYTEPTEVRLQSFFDHMQTLKWIDCSEDDFFFVPRLQKMYRKGKRKCIS